MERHLIVVSVDALVFEDLEYARMLPNFKRFIEGGSLIERVRTIYPTLTHSIHATIITGAPAGVTGIINNEEFRPGERVKVWYNSLGQIRCDTLLHAAKRAGLTTAVSTWPVTSGEGDVIDYLVPGVLNYLLDGREDAAVDVYRECGMTENVRDIVAEGLRRNGIYDRHPEIDRFQVYCATEIIKRYKPNLMLVHPGHVDAMRHRYGLFSDKVQEAIRLTNSWLGEIYGAVVEAGILDTTDFIILSDHGHLGITRAVVLNSLLREQGYIRVTDDGELIDYDIFVHPAGLSAQVYLRDDADEELYEKAYKLFTDMCEVGIYGIGQVFKKEEVKEKYGLDGEFSFVLEGDGYSKFSERLVGPIAEALPTADVMYGHSAHGHLPERGPQPPFIAYGPDFKAGVVIPEGNILNHAPTMAKVLGITLRDSVGVAVDEILK